MPLTQQQFEALVARLEKQASAHPSLYKIKLGAFASLGYVYIAAALVVLLAAVAGMLAILAMGKAFIFAKVLIPLVVLIGVVFRSLWVTLHAPQGLELRRQDYPALFEAIDAIRRFARAPRVHAVLLTNEVNASVSQVPRLGLFGWQKNYLVIGLPLMQILSADEFKAVLAHEFGHLSGAHGRFGAWIYRIRLSWARLAERLEKNSSWGRFMFVPFFEWYAPTFAAYSFVQARRQEYEADQLAARTAGASAVATSLVRLNLKSQDLANAFWPSILSAADSAAQPPELPYSSLLLPDRRAFVGEPHERLSHALEQNTSAADTHPCLRERLAALALEPEVPPPVAESAATVLFGRKLDDLVAHFDNEWARDVSAWWRSRHEHVTASRAKLAAFAARDATKLNDVELYEYALLVEEFDDPVKAFDLYRTLVLERGARRGAKFAYARHLLQRGDESAIRMLDEVMIEAPEFTLGACELIVSHLRAHGRDSETQPFVKRYLERRGVEQQMRAERESIKVTDKWLPPTLPPVSLAKLTERLKRHPDVKMAFLVRKQLPENQVPLHVVGVLRRSGFLGGGGNGANRRLIRELARDVHIPEPLFFIWLNGEQRKFLILFEVVEGSRIV